MKRVSVEGAFQREMIVSVWSKAQTMDSSLYVEDLIPYGL